MPPESQVFQAYCGAKPPRFQNAAELECTKAARGTAAPIAHEFPWGTSTTDRLKRVMGPDDDLVTTARTYTHVVVDERELDYAELLP